MVIGLSPKKLFVEDAEIQGAARGLFESSIRTRVLPDVGSATLTTRLQVYGYAAFTAARQPKGIVEIGGAGLVAPTF